MLTVMILGIHVLLVQTLGMSKPISIPENEIKEVPFFPNFILKDSLGWMIILALIGVLCVFFPWEIGQKADPFAATPLGIKPEWYFTFMFTTLKIIPSHILAIEGELLAIFGFMVGGLLLMLVPFLDRLQEDGRTCHQDRRNQAQADADEQRVRDAVFRPPFILLRHRHFSLSFAECSPV